MYAILFYIYIYIVIHPFGENLFELAKHCIMLVLKEKSLNFNRKLLFFIIGCPLLTRKWNLALKFVYQLKHSNLILNFVI